MNLYLHEIFFRKDENGYFIKISRSRLILHKIPNQFDDYNKSSHCDQGVNLVWGRLNVEPSKNPIVISLESEATVLRSNYISGELQTCITWTDNML